MLNRRQFLKLLGAIPLAFGLCLPVAEPEPEPAWEGCVERVTVTTKDNASKSIYVWPYGDDANDGLSVQGAKRTIAAAFDVVGTNDIVVHFGG